MRSPSRLLRWLLLPLLAFCSLNALADTSAQAAQALHLLGYLGADYPATVASGEVLDAGEYGEQLEFVAVLQGLIVALPTRPEQAEVERGVANLRQGIEGLEEGAGSPLRLGSWRRSWPRPMRSVRPRQSPPTPPAAPRCSLSTVVSVMANRALAMARQGLAWSPRRPICAIGRGWIG